MEIPQNRFRNILVTPELLPVRDAAGCNDLEAMFTLLNHVLQGKYTRQCGQTAFEIINIILDHEELKDDLPRAWNVYFLSSQAVQLLYQQGKNSYQEAIRSSCNYLQWMIDAMISAPRWMWNYPQLEYAMNWIKAHEPQINYTQTD